MPGTKNAVAALDFFLPSSIWWKAEVMLNLLIKWAFLSLGKVSFIRGRAPALLSKHSLGSRMSITTRSFRPGARTRKIGEFHGLSERSITLVSNHSWTIFLMLSQAARDKGHWRLLISLSLPGLNSNECLIIWVLPKPFGAIRYASLTTSRISDFWVSFKSGLTSKTGLSASGIEGATSAATSCAASAEVVAGTQSQTPSDRKENYKVVKSKLDWTFSQKSNPRIRSCAMLGITRHSTLTGYPSQNKSRLTLPLISHRFPLTARAVKRWVGSNGIPKLTISSAAFLPKI